MDRARVLAAVAELIDALETPSGTGTDELICLTRAALERAGYEHAPIVRHAELGELRTVRIGRRRYTTRAWLVALAERLPAVRSSEAESDDLVNLARRRAARRSA